MELFHCYNIFSQSKTFKGLEIDLPQGLKRCYKCGRFLPLSYFHKDSSRPDGLHHRCRDCKSRMEKLRRDKNKKGGVSYGR